VFRAQAGEKPLFEQPSALPLEEYMLRLACQGALPLDDLATLEADQLRRTYHLLGASEAALTEANRRMNSKLTELEAAQRVMEQRTAVLVALQDIGQGADRIGGAGGSGRPGLPPSLRAVRGRPGHFIRPAPDGPP
jgi:hypothetical protein